MKINALKMQILMGEQNLTIKELACRSNVSRQTISCIKSGADSGKKRMKIRLNK